jgi:hypothetical protein
MVSLEEFYNQFMDRHEFVYEDSETLSKRFRNISFYNIPEAWVYLVDKFLSMMNQVRKIRSVSQVYGFLVVDCKDLSDFDKNILADLELHLKVLDIDLHNQIEEGIILH